MAKSSSKKSRSPRIAHVDFNIEKERNFVKYVKYLSNPFHIMWRNFLVGTFQGLGFVLGTALLLTVIGFVFSSFLGQISFFKDISQALDLWLNQNLVE